MRTFIAIELPESIQQELARHQAALRSVCRDARWTRPDGIHLTLKFLGEINDSQVRHVTDALQGLRAFSKFPVEIRGFGFFPDARCPRVFWAGVVAPPELDQLAGRVEDTMEKLGIAREQRAYNPHLTLARFREPRPQPALRGAVEPQSQLGLGQFEATEFFLYESKLAPQGAEYLKVARFPV